MIPEYAESIAARLAFDEALARSVRAEVEDHLWEAVAADTEGRGAAAEGRAIANFGDAQALAGQIAAVSLTRQARAIAFGVMAIVAAVFIAMKVRVAWFALVQPAPAGDWSALAGTVLGIDRFAFWLSLAAALGAWAWLATAKAPEALDSRYRRRLRRFLVFASVAMAALVASVACDSVLAALRLAGAQWTFGNVVPVASIALEVIGAAIVVRHVRLVSRRAALAADALHLPA